MVTSQPPSVSSCTTVHNVSARRAKILDDVLVRVGTVQFGAGVGLQHRPSGSSGPWTVVR
jgi:transcription elongation GreA/GreB family factor